MNYQVKDSGNRREFGTGAVRDMGEGKGRTDLLPFFALLEVSKHMEAGAEKYGDENWRKGIPLRTYLDSAVRHLFKFALGMRDERHDLAAAWNVLCLIETAHMVGRGILPKSLLNLPDWWTPPGSPTDDQIDAALRGTVDNWLTVQDGPTPPRATDVLANIADAYATGHTQDFVWVEPAYTSTFSDGPLSDFRPIAEVNDWLTSGLTTEQLNRTVNVEYVDTAEPVPVVYPTINLNEHDREYTRGHADDTAARFNAGLPYADDLMVDELPQAADVQAAADADVNDGEYAPLPSPGQIVEAVMHEAAEAIGGHPLFGVVIIDGPDAAEYDGPEVCGIKPDTCGCYGSPPEDPNPLDGMPFAVLRRPEHDDTRRWVVQGGIVYYAPDTHTTFKDSFLSLDTIRAMVASRNLVIDQIGRGG